jgi:murein DD-endopeptidase MepM/ murein hydrolase activator NlpD
MVERRLVQLRQLTARFFPDRYIYMRSGGEMRSFALTGGLQMTCAGVIAALIAWTLISTVSVLGQAVVSNAGDQAAAKTKAYYERLIADRQARLNSAVAELTSGAGSLEALATQIEKRHAALALLLSEARGQPGAAQALAPIELASLQGKAPIDQIQAIRADQERLVSTAEGMAKTRADRLRLAFRLAGLDASSYSGRGLAGEGLGGPLVEAKDPSALAAILDVDEDFAGRIQSAARDLNAVRTLTVSAQRLPLAKPLDNPVRSSGYGVRFDPFTGRPAFHAGQDFAGRYMMPVEATAPGVVSFTGVRSGYGNTVELDHGGGFKTRYAHLAAISVRPGQRVALGQRLGGMGSTGRSTGVHLHYEVWQNGRVQDPTRFLRAGDYVQQNARAG